MEIAVEDIKLETPGIYGKHSNKEDLNNTPVEETIENANHFSPSQTLNKAKTSKYSLSKKSKGQKESVLGLLNMDHILDPDNNNKNVGSEFQTGIAFNENNNCSRLDIASMEDATLQGINNHDTTANQNGGITTLITPVKESQMDTFQNWAINNYGENSKTKTVTSRKYERIFNVLAGEELPSSENAKFRFWVKTKGFKLGPCSWRNGMVDGSMQVLYVPTKVQTVHGTVKEFKRVAKVEDFFDIIHSMHVDPDCRGGKHAGQKRTYRAIAETYAFLPREAVTRFLMSCEDCQKRMHLSTDSTGRRGRPSKASPVQFPLSQSDSEGSNLTVSDFDTSFNFNMPITTAYLNHIKKKSKDVLSSVESINMSEDFTDIYKPKGLGNSDCNLLDESDQQDNIGLNLSKNSHAELQQSPGHVSPNQTTSLDLSSDENQTEKKQDYSPKTKSRVGKALYSFLGRKGRRGSDIPYESTSLRPSNILYKPYEKNTLEHHSPKNNLSTTSQVKNHSPLPGAIPTDNDNNATTMITNEENTKHNTTLPLSSADNLNYNWFRSGTVGTEEMFMHQAASLAYMTQLGYNRLSPKKHSLDLSNEPTNLSTRKHPYKPSILPGQIPTPLLPAPPQQPLLSTTSENKINNIHRTNDYTLENNTGRNLISPFADDLINRHHQNHNQHGSNITNEHLEHLQQNQLKLLTIRQLILGYRESAAFLYRSAQELEQLILKYT